MQFLRSHFSIIFLTVLISGAGDGYAQQKQVSPYLPTHAEVLQAYQNADMLDSALKKTPVVNNISPHWQADSKLFWYAKKMKSNLTDYFLVNADRGDKHKVFDSKQMADAVGALLGKPVPLTKFYISEMFFSPDKKQVTFKTANNWLKCDLASYQCEKTTDTVFKAYDASLPLQSRRYRWEGLVTDSVSPDKQWTAFVRGGNVFIRSVKDNSTIQFTKDGSVDKPYGEVS